jgi:hypothetical protein
LAAALREAMGIPGSTRDQRHDRMVVEAQSALPPESFAAAHAAGANYGKVRAPPPQKPEQH